jgi:D-amino-acid dehydrogenase
VQVSGATDDRRLSGRSGQRIWGDMSEPHVVIVGAGVAGAATAFALARRGAAVTVLDAARPGTATAAGAGIVQPWSSAVEDGPYYELYARGAAYYPELLESLAAAGVESVDFRRTGSLVVSADPAVLTAAEQRLAARRAAGAPTGEVQRLPNARARELFPPLATGLDAVYVPGGGRVDGRTLRDGLLAGAQRYGAEIRNGLCSLVRTDIRARVRVDDTEIAADAVVVAAGAWSDAVLEPTGHRVDVEPQRGQITHLRLDGVETGGWPTVLPLSGHYLVAFDDSRVVVGATRETGSGFDARLTAAGQREVLDQALRVAPGLANATVLETRVGLRPLPADGIPRLGAVPGAPGVFVNAGFGAGGLTMAPAAGDALAAVVLGQAPALDLRPFAP